MTSDELWSVLSASTEVDRFVDGTKLPELAEVMLPAVDSPGLVQLAILTAEQKILDPRDAREASRRALAEEGIAIPAQREAAEILIAIVARAYLEGRCSARTLTFAASRLVISAFYAISRQAMGLYGLDDAWDAGWAGPEELIERQVRDNALELLAAQERVSKADITDVEWSCFSRLLWFEAVTHK